VTTQELERDPADLVALLDLEQIDTLIFRAEQPDDPRQELFGGQVIAQALKAVSLTVEPGRPVHSLHAFFLLRGDPREPIVFLVEPIRDGRSYTTRTVIARQGGTDIFEMTASFHVPEEGLTHEPTPPPGLVDGTPRIPRAEQLTPTGWVRGFRHPVTITPVPAAGDDHRPVRDVWARSAMPLPDDPIAHACAIAYSTDLTLLPTALVPHGLTAGSGDVVMASIDHSMWFHRPVRADQWLLHHTESPIAGGGRTLTRSEIYDVEGTLVASTAQEGVLRLPRKRS